MPRIARLIVNGEQAFYHVISRTALDGFVLGNVEKEYLLKLMKHLSSVYFAEVLGFCFTPLNLFCHYLTRGLSITKRRPPKRKVPKNMAR